MTAEPQARENYPSGQFYPEDPDKRAAFEEAVAGAPDSLLEIALLDREDRDVPTWDEWIERSVAAEKYSAGTAMLAVRLVQLLQLEYASQAEGDDITAERLREIEDLADTDGASGGVFYGAIAQARYYTIAGERAYGRYISEDRGKKIGRRLTDILRAFSRNS